MNFSICDKEGLLDWIESILVNRCCRNPFLQAKLPCGSYGMTWSHSLNGPSPEQCLLARTAWPGM